MPVRHRFRPPLDNLSNVKYDIDDWRIGHRTPPFCVMSIGELAPVVMTNLPAADQPFPPGALQIPRSAFLHWTYVNQVRMLVNVRTAGSAGTYIEARWLHVDEDLREWLPIDDFGTNFGRVTIDAVGLRDTGWFGPGAGFLSPFDPHREVALFVGGGNGVADPAIGLVTVYML